MTLENLDRTQRAASVYAMINAVVFGSFLTTILTTSALSDRALFWAPILVTISIIVSAPLAWFMVPAAKLQTTHIQQ